MASVSPYVPTYHDTPVNFSGPTSSGNATVHYVEAGSPSFPTVLLLHGFASSSYQYREFIPLLSDSYHVLAPDIPGFGLTTVPDNFNYTFDNLAAVITAWILALNLSPFALYIFDYGAPVGLRFAIQHPDKIKAIISQNGNAYNEGFGQPFWQPVFNLWNSSNAEAEREVIRNSVLTLETTKYQYTEGVPEADYPLLNPSAWTFDYLQNIAGENNTEHQVDLFYDYRTNPGTYYPKFHEYFRNSKVPILAVWGKGDPAFIPPGAEAFKQDSPDAVVRFVDSGHFALETKRWEIARIMRGWLTSIGY
ncbi:hypothetical protein M409DRAFT_62047 [Zasmidium cellare ATCC 36951]|uniref:AB hydrolase-1 domain-containing protein n=1 Tax=Zasmidium cellare ATCC 36951 TaxID=1080233 RepID=A0A6A6D5Z7_ZASCE|nr:uncharacterized protein M409DRAFT_62047 [Zasmidium cellare ATCC 36951]KAF2173790.1 hypothetical protein M409DRAFT_62047 [Zasmidium cellare ATCC 36951]